MNKSLFKEREHFMHFLIWYEGRRKCIAVFLVDLAFGRDNFILPKVLQAKVRKFIGVGLCSLLGKHSISNWHETHISNDSFPSK